MLFCHQTKYIKIISTKNDQMVSTVKLYMLKLVPKLKTNKSLKSLLVDMKTNSSILMRLEIAGMAQNKQKRLIFIVVSRVKVENQISWVS